MELLVFWPDPYREDGLGDRPVAVVSAPATVIMSPAGTRRLLGARARHVDAGGRAWAEVARSEGVPLEAGDVVVCW